MPLMKYRIQLVAQILQIIRIQLKVTLRFQFQYSLNLNQILIQSKIKLYKYFNSSSQEEEKKTITPFQENATANAAASAPKEQMEKVTIFIKDDTNEANFKELNTCHICYQEIENPYMCPTCQYICCKKCLMKWTRENGKCPQCRKELSEFEIIPNLAVKNLIEDWKKKVEVAGCQDHFLQIVYFCDTCKKGLCADCMAFSDIQHGHKINRIKNIEEEIKSKVIKVGDKVNEPKEKLIQQRNKIKELISKCNSLFEEREKELDKFIEDLKNSLIYSHKKTLLQLEKEEKKYTEKLNEIEFKTKEIEDLLLKENLSSLLEKQETYFNYCENLL